MDFNTGSQQFVVFFLLTLPRLAARCFELDQDDPPGLCEEPIRRTVDTDPPYLAGEPTIGFRPLNDVLFNRGFGHISSSRLLLKMRLYAV